MKKTPEIESEKWLKPWQRKSLILLIAVTGVVATHALMLWLERRKATRNTPKEPADIIDV